MGKRVYKRENKHHSGAKTISETQAVGESATQMKDNRPEAIAQMKLQEKTVDNFSQQTTQKKENRTGLPDKLKSGIENLSGYSMDDVKVHYNSDRPAQLNAHAYAQGNQIHLAPGQEKHLPHEAWHVVQQKQRRVKPTKQMKSGVNINDDISLEKEADFMGAKVMKGENYPISSLRGNSSIPTSGTIQKVMSENEQNRLGKKLGVLINKSKGYFEKLFSMRRRLNKKVEKIPLGLGRNQAGLGNKDRINRYAAKMAGIGEVQDLGEFLRRAQIVINEFLEEADIPELEIDFGDPAGKAEFNPGRWEIDVDYEGLAKFFENKKYNAAVNILLHEARHAEQYWQFARKHPERTGFLPARVKDAASEMGAMTSGQKRLAGKVAHNFSIKGGQRNKKIIDKLVESRDQLKVLTEKAEQVLRDNSFNQYRSYIRQISRAMIKARYYYRLYRRQTAEIDAHAVGDAAGEVFSEVQLDENWGIQEDESMETVIFMEDEENLEDL